MENVSFLESPKKLAQNTFRQAKEEMQKQALMSGLVRLGDWGSEVV